MAKPIELDKLEPGVISFWTRIAISPTDVRAGKLLNYIRDEFVSDDTTIKEILDVLMVAQWWLMLWGSELTAEDILAKDETAAR